MFAATGDYDLAGLVIEAVVPFELLRDGLAKFDGAAAGGVFGEATLDGLDCRILDVLRRVEVRFAGPESDHIHSLLAELGGLGGDGQGCRRSERSRPV